MPDVRTHQGVGAAAGAFDAWYQAKNIRNADLFMETIGGALGGYVGGTLPDILEPAVSSWHRNVGHSVATGTGVLALRTTLVEMAQQCRNNAQRLRAIQMVPAPGTSVFVPAAPDPLKRLFSDIGVLLWNLFAGFLNGLAAGYASHLLMDAATPRGIPLVAGRF